MSSIINESINSQKEVLANLIDVTDDSIVSKTLAKNNGGSVVLFAFDAKQGLSEHTSPVDALIYIVEGDAIITIGSNENQLSVGETIVMPANIPHAVKAETKMKMLLIMLKI